jgi:hypothetical protein
MFYDRLAVPLADQASPADLQAHTCTDLDVRIRAASVPPFHCSLCSPPSLRLGMYNISQVGMIQKG